MTTNKKLANWKKAYNSVTQQKPTPDSILRTFDGDRVRIRIDLREGKAPTLYAHAYVPCICGQEPEVVAWYARGEGETSLTGLRCILLPQAAQAVIARNPDLPTNVFVKALRVIRTSESGKSLLVEVAEFDDPADEAPADEAPADEAPAEDAFIVSGPIEEVAAF